MITFLAGSLNASIEFVGLVTFTSNKLLLFVTLGLARRLLIACDMELSHCNLARLVMTLTVTLF